MSPLLQIFTYALIPTVAMALAGAIGAFRTPGEKLRSAILHAAGGIVFAAVSLEFLPAIVHEHATWATVVGFALGAAVSLGLRSFFKKLGVESTETAPAGALIAITGVDVFVDGCMIGIGFATGAKAGLFITIALSMEALALGLSVAATLRKAAKSRAYVIAVVAGIGLLFALGSILGGWPLQNVSKHSLAGVIAFGSAAMLFLVTEELLAEAHEVPDSPLLTGAFFAGFLAYLVLEISGSAGG